MNTAATINGVAEWTVRTEAVGGTTIKVNATKYRDEPVSYYAYVSHQISVLESEWKGMATEFETYSYETAEDVLIMARTDAHKMNEVFSTYW